MPVSTRKRALDTESVASPGKKDKKTTPKRKLFAAQEDDVPTSSKKGRKTTDVAPSVDAPAANTVVAVKTPVKSSEKGKSATSKSTPTKSPGDETWRSVPSAVKVVPSAVKAVPSAVKVVPSAVKSSMKSSAVPPTPKTNNKAKKVVIHTPTALMPSSSAKSLRELSTTSHVGGSFWSNYKAAFANAMRTLTPIFVAIFLLCYVLAQYYIKIDKPDDGQQTATYGIACFVVYIAMLVAYSIALVPVVYILKDK